MERVLPAFLFTDIEGSTAKWQKHPRAMKAALLTHDSLIRDCASSHDGEVVKHTGDGFLLVFRNGWAIRCALEIQRKLDEQD